MLALDSGSDHARHAAQAARSELDRAAKPAPHSEPTHALAPNSERMNHALKGAMNQGWQGLLQADSKVPANTNPGSPGCTPASPAAPAYSGMKPGQVDRGPNGFRLDLKGPDPDLAVGGSHDEQEHQRDLTAKFSLEAAASYQTRQFPGHRWPSDESVANTLKGLKPNLPIGQDGKEVTHGLYQSNVPNASPQQVMDHWVNHADEVFKAGGMEIRPPVQKLENGRYMLELGGTNAPPTWLPVEIKVDPAQQSINIKTLDGHVLRGEQTFSFKDNGCGGTAIVQDARFQASSKLTGDLQKFLPIAQGQHEAWQNAHRESYEQFNGDKNYEGIGTKFEGTLSQLTALGGKAGHEIFAHPRRAADAAVDTTGDIGNLATDTTGKAGAWSADKLGQGAHKAFDVFGISGGERAEQKLHDKGQSFNKKLDHAGDWLESKADHLGDWFK